VAIEDLVAIFEEARRAGLLGPQLVAEQMAHSRALTAQLPPAAERIADLGSGAGLPGLVVAAERPFAHLTLVEVAERRADHLRRAVRRLGWTDRVEVAAEPAERVGRMTSHRGAFDAVVARSCAPPAVVAELAAPLLRKAGALVVASPVRRASRPGAPCSDSRGAVVPWWSLVDLLGSSSTERFT
jgi:16S rRNA (guanine527-N7)-methyltransferase